MLSLQRKILTNFCKRKFNYYKRKLNTKLKTSAINHPKNHKQMREIQLCWNISYDSYIKWKEKKNPREKFTRSLWSSQTNIDHQTLTIEVIKFTRSLWLTYSNWNQTQVNVDTILIESDGLPKAILDLVDILHIRKLVVGTTKSSLRSTFFFLSSNEYTCQKNSATTLTKHWKAWILKQEIEVKERNRDGWSDTEGCTGNLWAQDHMRRNRSCDRSSGRRISAIASGQRFRYLQGVW